MLTGAYFIGLLSAIAVMLGIAFYAFHLRERHPAKYTGLWRHFGNVLQTPQRALLIAIGLIVGTGAGAAINGLLHPSGTSSVVLGLDLLFLFVVFLSIVFGITLYRMRTGSENSRHK